MKTLIFDIETVGERWEEMDGKTRAFFEGCARKEVRRGADTPSNSPSKRGGEEDEAGVARGLEELKSEFGLSPLTGKIVTIGVRDADSDRGAVYFQAPGETVVPFEEEGVKFEAMDESAMLAKFWDIAQRITTFVSFNGRTFDVPFLLLRSAAHRIPPTKDLMSNRYLSSQRFDAKHVDLKDQLTWYGAYNRRHALHLYCRAFGIESPKGEEADGSKVGEMFHERRFLDIARYNARDLRATKQLYDVWREYMQPSAIGARPVTKEYAEVRYEEAAR